MEDVAASLKKSSYKFEAIVKDYYGSINFVVKNVLGTRTKKQDIEDCISEVLLSIWNSLDEYDESKCSMKTWVSIISRRKSIDYIRKLVNIKEESLGKHRSRRRS